MQQKLIQISDVWKQYQMGKASPLVVLSGINLEIKQGEFVAITGPSGSGKSTMMNIVGALDIPSRGIVKLKEKNISDMSESELAHLRGQTIGFIFQQFNLLPTLSALKNVMLPMEMIDVPTEEAKARATKLLEMLGLGERLHHKPNELSGGQQQRVAIARSLANNAPVILADEPTGNLDSKTGKFVMDFLEDLCCKEGKTIILITHDLDLVNYADRVVHILDGKIEKIVENKKSRKRNFLKGTSKKHHAENIQRNFLKGTLEKHHTKNVQRNFLKGTFNKVPYKTETILKGTSKKHHANLINKNLKGGRKNGN